MQDPNMWLVMQYRDDEFEVQGVYNSEELAVSTCKTNQYIVIPMTLNESLPDERMGEDEFNDRMFYPIE